MPQTSPPPPAREVKLFRNNRSQAIRIPAEFELPGDRARIRKEGDRLIVEPVRPKQDLLALLKKWADESPLGPEDDFPDIDEGLLPLEDDVDL